MGKQRITLSGNGRTLVLNNPVLTASGTFGYGLEYTPFGNLASLGGIVAKGLSLLPRKGNPMPRIAETPCGMLNAVGLQNCGFEEFVKRKLPKLPHKDVPIIANLYATSPEEFAELAGKLAATEGIAALEVNISCPNVKEGGASFGQNATMAAKVTEAVVKASGTLPVLVKLSPNVTSIAEIAKACEGAGATALSCINTVTGMGVDLHSKRPLLANVIGGLSGPAIKPIALRCVWEVSRAVSIPVIGIGGITTPEDVLEFILVGASAVQVGTANIALPDSAFRIAEALPLTMHKYGVSSLDELRGSLKV